MSDTNNCDDSSNDNTNRAVGRGLSAVGDLLAGIANWTISFGLLFLPFVLAFIIVYFIANKVTLPGVLIMGLLAIMIFIFLTSMTGSNLAGSLPFATYPIPPHLGLDGINLQNRYF